ncbi:MAG: AbrB/MazE/SpoVT family DNA-binding domain-containing protein [Desulfovibrio sp.]|nr:MAG: AbrB/MazE/SpoVT family DNA-binding domain-containing protein [Desulfovibrio sp.]
MHTLKIHKIGDSHGVVLPKEVLARLGVGEGDMICLAEAPDGFRLTPANKEFAEQVQAADTIMHDDRGLLRELAKR